jgi:hypothetical protein
MMLMDGVSSGTFLRNLARNFPVNTFREMKGLKQRETPNLAREFHIANVSECLLLLQIHFGQICLCCTRA